jgi:hypothetical protein
MQHMSISCRFSGFYIFSGADVDPDSENNRPTTEVLREMQGDFELLINKLADDNGRWGPVEWIEVSLADDYEDYEDSTLIEHFFRIQCELAEEEDTETTLEKVKIELQEYLQAYAPERLTVDGF